MRSRPRSRSKVVFRSATRASSGGYPPSLVAGDLETDDTLPVTVNGSLHGQRAALVGARPL